MKTILSVSTLILLTTLSSLAQAKVIANCSATNGYSKFLELVIEEKAGQLSALVGIEGSEEMEAAKSITLVEKSEIGDRYLIKAGQEEGLVYISKGSGPTDKKAMAAVISADMKQISLLKCK